MEEKAKIKAEMVAGGLRFEPERGCLVSSEPHMLQMDRKNFSYKRELRALFADLNQFGGEESKEREDRNEGVNAI